MVPIETLVSMFDEPSSGSIATARLRVVAQDHGLRMLLRGEGGDRGGAERVEEHAVGAHVERLLRVAVGVAADHGRGRPPSGPRAISSASRAAVAAMAPTVAATSTRSGSLPAQPSRWSCSVDAMACAPSVRWSDTPVAGASDARQRVQPLGQPIWRVWRERKFEYILASMKEKLNPLLRRVTLKQLRALAAVTQQRHDERRRRRARGHAARRHAPAASARGDLRAGAGRAHRRGRAAHRRRPGGAGRGRADRLGARRVRRGDPGAARHGGRPGGGRRHQHRQVFRALRAGGLQAPAPAHRPAGHGRQPRRRCWRRSRASTWTSRSWAARPSTSRSSGR